MPNSATPIDKAKVSEAVNKAKAHNNWFAKGKIQLIFTNSTGRQEEIRFGLDKNKLVITGRDTDKNGAFNTLYLFEDGGVSQKYNSDKNGHKLTHSNWVSSTLEKVLTKMTEEELHQPSVNILSGYAGYYCGGGWYSLSEDQQVCPNGQCKGFHEQ